MNGIISRHGQKNKSDFCKMYVHAEQTLNYYRIYGNNVYAT
jgi:hypothetical protein